MWSLLLQSLALLLAAYFIGVWFGCMARRLIAPPRSRVTVDDGQRANLPEHAPTPLPTPAPTAPAAPAPQPAPAKPSVADPALQAAAGASAAVATDTATQPAPAAQPSAPPAPSVAQQIQTIGTDADPVAARSHIKPEPFPDGRLPAAAGGGGDAASAVAAVVSQPEATAPPRPLPQDLTAIRGIDAATAVVLEREGVTRYEQLSAWNEGDVARINRALGGMRRVQEENWIEQAKILASGGLTTFARRRKANAAAGAPAAPQIVQPSPDQGDGLSLAAPIAATIASAPVAAAPTGAAPTATDPSNVMADVAGDDLTALRGITPEIATMLKEQGIARYAQVARLGEPEANRLNNLLGVKDRVQREGWIAQAAQLSGLPDSSSEIATATVAATAASTSSTSGTETTAGEAQNRDANAAADQNDNLKRIRGIGELIERKLYAMGFVNYAAIADWTETDVRQVSQALDFRGRIERENWIEQARILASGGQTEFSRRFDTGA